MMRLKKAILTVGAGVFIGHAAAMAQDEEEIRSPTFELNLEQEETQLKEATAAAEPLQESLDEGLKKLNEKIQEYQENPNMLTKSEFERAYAENVKSIVNDMDHLFRYRDQAVWAFDDIRKKIKLVSETLEHNQEQAKQRVQRKAEDVNKLAEEIKELRRKIEAKDEPPEELVRKLQQKTYRYKFTKQNYKLLEQLRNEQAGIRDRLKEYETGVARIGNNLQSWYDSLADVRTALLERAKTGQDMAELRKMLVAQGPASINRMMSRIQGMMDDMDGLNKVMQQGYQVVGDTHGTQFSVAPDEEGVDGAPSLDQLLKETEDIEKVQVEE